MYVHCCSNSVLTLSFFVCVCLVPRRSGSKVSGISIFTLTSDYVVYLISLIQLMVRSEVNVSFWRADRVPSTARLNEEDRQDGRRVT